MSTPQKSLSSAYGAIARSLNSAQDFDKCPPLLLHLEQEKMNFCQCCKGGQILTIQHSIAHRKITASHRLAGTYNIILIEFTGKVSHSHEPCPQDEAWGWVLGRELTECS